MVGNGAFIKCQGQCPSVNISLQTANFTIPFYLLPIEGVDVVLGIEWLRTLGSIQADFSIPNIAFTHQDQHITLQAKPNPIPTGASYHQFRQFLSTRAMASLHLLSMEHQPNPTLPIEISLQTPSSPLYDLPFPIQSLLLHHKTIFQAPQGLLPSRPHDHHIPLIPNTNPINVRPYRYPHSQNDTISKLIYKMPA